MGRPRKLATVARRGDKRETLVTLRNNLAEAIDNTKSGRDIAALSKRLMEVMEELENMPQDGLDEQSPLKRAQLNSGA